MVGTLGVVMMANCEKPRVDHAKTPSPFQHIQSHQHS